MTDSGGPMQGIKVLDIGTMLSAPLAAGVLADQGAEVIKVEVPGIGDLMRYVGATCKGVGSLFQGVNRGKRCLALDLKKPEALEIVKRIASEADVVTQNFRPGVAEKLGVDYETLSALNPDLIYLSVTGFGHEGPMSDRPAYDAVVQSFAGVPMSQADMETGEPRNYHQIFADKISAAYASQSVTAALFARERGAGGQHIRIAMVDAVAAFMWPDVGGVATFRSGEAATGIEPARGVPLIKFRNGYAQVSPLNDAHFHAWAAVFGIDTSDPRVASLMDRAANTDYMAELTGQLMDNALDMDVDEAIAQMEAVDVPCAKLLHVGELPSHPQMVANGLFVESEHPVAGPIVEPKHPAKFSVTPSGCGFASGAVGQHNEEVLAELGYSAENIEALKEVGVFG
jgi:crotonobetainyl-CoA:carnitine CoA-transferase CaiB-like acyl-CoA transferase